MARAVQEVERAEHREALSLWAATGNFLGNAFWREHEAHGYCCVDCDPNHPGALLRDAQREIADYRRGVR